MTTSKEQEAFGLVIEHQKSGASESDIRFAFQRFMDIAGVAPANEMSTEGPPGIGNPGRMDLYLHNTCIEFKTNILKGGVPDPEFVAQLDGYIGNLLKAGTGVRNGILTDGIHYFLRRLGDEKPPLLPYSALQNFEHPNRPPTSASTCTGSSLPRPKTSAPRQKTSKSSSAQTPILSVPAIFC